MVVITHTTQATLPNDPSKEVSSDAWNEGHTVTGLATVAGTGSYNDLTDKPAAGVTLADVIAALYPVGALKFSSDNVNPGTYLSGTTWAAWGSGRVLVGYDAGDADFDTAEETSGAKTVSSAGTVSQPNFTGSSAQSTSAITAGTPAGTISWPAGVPTASGSAVDDHAAHTHSVTSNVSGTLTPAGAISWPAGVPTFSGSALGTHQHELPFQLPTTTSIRQTAVGTFGTGTSRAATATITTTANTTSAAVALSEAKSAGTPAGTVAWPAGVPTFAGTSNQAVSMTNNAVTSGNPSAALTHTVTQPTIAWPAGVPSFVGSALSTHAHTLTPAGTVSQPTFTGSPTSVVQPSIVGFMWKRTA